MSGAIVLGDGRRLAYCEYGPTDGAPVLFIPGAGCGRLMSFGSAVLADHVVRLILLSLTNHGEIVTGHDSCLNGTG